MNQWNNKIEEIQKFLSHVENKSIDIAKFGEFTVKDKAVIDVGVYFAHKEIETLRTVISNKC